MYLEVEDSKGALSVVILDELSLIQQDTPPPHSAGPDEFVCVSVWVGRGRCFKVRMPERGFTHAIGSRWTKSSNMSAWAHDMSTEHQEAEM